MKRERNNVGNLAERNRLSNKYRQEAIELGQRSPYRQSIYIAARLKGKSPEAALAESRVKRPHRH